jgi:hypothetical protein
MGGGPAAAEPVSCMPLEHNAARPHQIPGTVQPQNWLLNKESPSIVSCRLPKK